MVTDVAAIREAYDRASELATVAELRQRFRGITDNEQATRCVRSVLIWKAPDILPTAIP